MVPWIGEARLYALTAALVDGIQAHRLRVTKHPLYEQLTATQLRKKAVDFAAVDARSEAIMHQVQQQHDAHQAGRQYEPAASTGDSAEDGAGVG